MQICKCELLKMCTIVGWDRSKSNAFFYFEPPEGNPTSQFVELSRLRISSKMFNTRILSFLSAGNFLPHPLQCGFLTPLVCGCELWRCLDVHIMWCSSLAAGCNKASEQSWCVAAIAAWHTSKKCQRSGADKVGVNPWLPQIPFWSVTFVFSLFLSLVLSCCFPVCFWILYSSLFPHCT